MENEQNNNNNNDEEFSQELRQFVRALGHERINTQNMNTRELRYAFPVPLIMVYGNWFPFLFEF